jgi:hypothetical protein
MLKADGNVVVGYLSGISALVSCGEETSSIRVHQNLTSPGGQK